MVKCSSSEIESFAQGNLLIPRAEYALDPSGLPSSSGSASAYWRLVDS